MVYYRPEREAQVLRRIIERDPGPLAGDSVAHFPRDHVRLPGAGAPLQVALPGPEGTFTQAARSKHFGHAAICVPQTTIDTVFAQVESGECNYGVVPVENSTEGMVSHTGQFRRLALKISGEVECASPSPAGENPALRERYRAHLRHQQATRPVPQLAGPALSPVEREAVRQQQ